MAKENWELIQAQHDEVDHVLQSKIQSLRGEFENLVMKKYEMLSDFSSQFTEIISKLIDLGERLEETKTIANHLR